jgi:hypothetical protein
MKPSQRPTSGTGPHRASSRHEFVIGPLCETKLSSRKARLYYCRLCDWSFLVCGSKVAVLDGTGEPLSVSAGISRFSTLADGPCPALEAFASAALPDAAPIWASLPGKFNELGHLALRRFSARLPRPRPWLRALGGSGANIGKR